MKSSLFHELLFVLFDSLLLRTWSSLAFSQPNRVEGERWREKPGEFLLEKHRNTRNRRLEPVDGGFLHKKRGICAQRQSLPAAHNQSPCSPNTNTLQDKTVKTREELEAGLLRWIFQIDNKKPLSPFLHPNYRSDNPVPFQSQRDWQNYEREKQVTRYSSFPSLGLFRQTLFQQSYRLKGKRWLLEKRNLKFTTN